MHYKLSIASALVLAFAVSGAAAAQNVDPGPPAPPPTYASLATLEVPVVAGDIADRPYRVIGEIKAGVRKATIFSKGSSQAKIYRELWERARKLDADAVVNATYGESHVTALSWGQTNARGQAIKFLTDEEAAARTVAPPADVEPAAQEAETPEAPQPE